MEYVEVIMNNSSNVIERLFNSQIEDWSDFFNLEEFSNKREKIKKFIFGQIKERDYKILLY